MFKLSASILSLLLTAYIPAAAQEETSTIPEVFKTPQALVAGIYDAFSADVGKTPDWEYVKSHFHPDALVILRASRTESKKFDLEGFIQDFVDFYKRIDPNKNGFKEVVVSIKTVEFGNIAQCFVVYEASVPTSGRPAQRGLDCWHLMKKYGRWWVVSIVNEIGTGCRPHSRTGFRQVIFQCVKIERTNS